MDGELKDRETIGAGRDVTSAGSDDRRARVVSVGIRKRE